MADKGLPIDEMDKEVISLCQAINELPGLRTTESCCGHSKGFFEIWFKAEKQDNLYVLARANSVRYGGPQWYLEVEITDVSLLPVYYLRSKTKGNDAYIEADKFAKNIRKELDFHRLRV